MDLDNLHSIGHAAQLIQALPDRIRLAADDLGIKPALRLNGVEHYRETDLERIATALRHRPADGVSGRAANLH